MARIKCKRRGYKLESKQVVALATHNLASWEHGEKSAGITVSWASCNCSGQCLMLLGHKDREMQLAVFTWVPCLLRHSLFAKCVSVSQFAHELCYSLVKKNTSSKHKKPFWKLGSFFSDFCYFCHPFPTWVSKLCIKNRVCSCVGNWSAALPVSSVQSPCLLWNCENQFIHPSLDKKVEKCFMLYLFCCALFLFESHTWVHLIFTGFKYYLCTCTVL